MTQASSGSSRIEITAAHSPLAFIYELFEPTITINGEVFRRRWGTHTFDVPPGDYEVSVSYPWVFAPECGKNSIRVLLQHGEVKKVKYTAELIRYLPGKITVE